jgi:hypothetical protein
MFVYRDVWFLPFSSMEPVAMLELHFIYTRVLYLYPVQNIFVLRLSFLSLLQRLVEIGANCYMVRRPSFILVSVMIGHNNKLTAIHA